MLSSDSRERLAQAGVDLVQRGGAGAQRLLIQRVERRLDGVEMGMQIFRVRIDVQQAGDDLALGGMLLKKSHGAEAVMRIVIGVKLAQRELGAVVLLDHLYRARRVIDRDRIAAGDDVE